MARKITLLPAGAYFAKRLDGVGGISDADLLSMAYAEIAADAPVSEDAARASLEQALLQQLRETIGADGAIISYETAAETTGNVLTVTLTAECEQEIGRAQATPDAEFLQLRPPAGEGTTADD